ncbi:MazG family protein [Allostreptomyces psammosilenae]|uniref:MazG family protein n=1 Tax=Allostreptomyces psammosilenae TaxID=1892865 RepID=A0A852ZVP3_9ACTN|nr:MazG family protein [Allostreptomyces psammosilenae]
MASAEHDDVRPQGPGPRRPEGAGPHTGSALTDLVAVMDRLRSPGGCPWDAEQSHASLLKYLIEEAYELVEAVETDDRAALREELGDVLLQVVFHARIAEEHPTDPFSLEQVAADLVDKLVYRHPHVFADATALSAADVDANWERLKAAEKGRASVVDGVPTGLPALALAAKLLSRARRGGVAVPDAPGGAVAAAAVGEAAGARVDEAAVGRLLLDVVALADRHGVDPEAALRAAALEYREKVREAERAQG